MKPAVRVRVRILPTTASLLLLALLPASPAAEAVRDRLPGSAPAFEIQILGARTTREPQTHITGGQFRDGVLTWNTAAVKPAEGEAFGIVEYRLTNKGPDRVEFRYKDMNLSVDGVRKDIVGEFVMESGPAFGSGIGYPLEGRASRQDRIIFTAREDGFRNITLQYGGVGPIDMDFGVKAPAAPATAPGATVAPTGAKEPAGRPVGSNPET